MMKYYVLKIDPLQIVIDIRW